MSAVGRTAAEVVKEVRRQFKENPEIMTFRSKPNYFTCVSIVTRAALREMRFPGLLTVTLPVAVGMLFRFIGENTGRPLLGAEVLLSFLMFATVSGILMAVGSSGRCTCGPRRDTSPSMLRVCLVVVDLASGCS